jgi:NAD(P)-dependent dehydrogenase (short-subunit alcohol dehydrogenase family)
MKQEVETLFDLTGRVAVITGGSGLLGFKHAQIIASAGGIPVLADVAGAEARAKAEQLTATYGVKSMGCATDITSGPQVEALLATVLAEFGTVDILINNAANDPKVDASSVPGWSRLENFPLAVWDADLAVGLTGAFLCSQVIGAEMARRQKGVIVNVASDLSIIAPDQRLYIQDGLPPDQQPVKPVTYSVVKTALVGLTRYLATYWAQCGVRVNAISPGGVYNDQPEEFVTRLARLIPLSRMARADEYQGAILFLCSDASSYMTGANLVVDGGRSCW